MGVRQHQLCNTHITLTTTTTTHNIMDVDRIRMSSDTHGSLLNRVYEMQCIREKEEAVAGIKDRTDMEKLSLALSKMCEVEEKMEEEESSQCEKFSQARARCDPVYILHQQQLQLQQQQHQQQQQNMIAFSSL